LAYCWSRGCPCRSFSHLVTSGFPSPAADHLEKHISLDELFEIRAPHVYLVKIEGGSTIGAVIYLGGW
jgi:DNA polymerase V